MPLVILALREFTPSPAQRAAWLAELPAARRLQLEQQPDASGRDRSLLGSRLLRLALQRLAGSDAPLASLRYPPTGKPRLAPPYDFSIAHCDGQVVCALADDGPVGIDVEAPGTQRADHFRLYLGEAERRWAGRDPQRFYTLWTRKEAIVKAADGEGLRELADVKLDPDSDRASFRGLPWHTASVPLGASFVAHLARREPLSALVAERISRETLL